MRVKILSRYDIGVTKDIWFLHSGNAQHGEYPGELDSRVFGQTIPFEIDVPSGVMIIDVLGEKHILEPWMIKELIKDPKPKTIEEILDKWR